MKKLLYIFAIVATGLVISCDKNEELFEAPVLDQEVVLSSEFDAAKSALDAMIGIATPIKGFKGDASANKSGNTLRIVAWDTTGRTGYVDGTYAHVTSEEFTACYDSLSPDADYSFDWDTDSNVLTIIIGSDESEVNINGDLQGAYDTAFGGDPLYFLARVALNSDNAYVVDGTQPTQVAAPAN